MCNEALDMLRAHADIKIEVITVNKINVQNHLRRDSNKLYNYMISLVVLEHVKSLAAFDLITDERSIKVKDQNMLKDYLQTKLRVKIGCPTIIQHTPAISAKNYNVQFVDWIAHLAWLHYEKNISDYFKLLRPQIKVRELFF